MATGGEAPLPKQDRGRPENHSANTAQRCRIECERIGIVNLSDKFCRVLHLQLRIRQHKRFDLAIMVGFDAGRFTNQNGVKPSRKFTAVFIAAGKRMPGDENVEMSFAVSAGRDFSRPKGDPRFLERRRH